MFWKWLRHCIHRWAFAFFKDKTNPNVDIKDQTSQSNCLSVSWKSHVCRGSFITNTKLERVQLSFFYIDWLQLQKSIAKFNFSGKCLRLFIFLSVPRGREGRKGQFNFKLRNLSFISALFDSWQISVFELHRSVLVFKLNYFSS